MVSLSIIITTLNAGDIFRECLVSVSNQSLKKEEYEILVVDAGSTDKTQDIAKEFGATVIIEKGANRAKGRQIGVEQAKGDIIVFTDADCIAENDWLEKLRDGLVGAAVVGGMVKTFKSPHILVQAEKWRIIKFFQRKTDNVNYVATWNAAFLKDAIKKVGGFDTRLGIGEDVDLCKRIVEAGYVIRIVPDAVVYHKHRTTWKGYLKQNYYYGQARAVLMKKHSFSMKLLTFFSLVTLSLINIMFYMAILAKLYPASIMEIILLMFPLLVVIFFNPYSFMLSLETLLALDPIFIMIPFIEYIRSIAQSLGFFIGLVFPSKIVLEKQ